MSDPILEATNLVKRYGKTFAANKISFQIQAGEFLGVIGPNGSGKTTLVNLITRFIKPDRGKVFFQGRDISNLKPHTIANMGIVRSFQMAIPLYHLPAYKNVVVALRSPRVLKQFRWGRYGDRDDIAIDILEEVGFERDSFVPYKLASALPHGYLKRMELARCMAMRPTIYILDELFSGMSLSEVAATMPIIENMKERGDTIIMIEHRLKELFQLADRVMVLNFGQNIAEGPPDTILHDESVQSAYIGSEIEEVI